MGETAWNHMADDMTVSEIMQRWPGTIGVFLQFRMLCVGCSIGPFHTIAEACDEHHLDETEFRTELGHVIGETVRTDRR